MPLEGINAIRSTPFVEEERETRQTELTLKGRKVSYFSDSLHGFLTKVLELVKKIARIICHFFLPSWLHHPDRIEEGLLKFNRVDSDPRNSLSLEEFFCDEELDSPVTFIRNFDPHVCLEQAKEVSFFDSPNQLTKGFSTLDGNELDVQTFFKDFSSDLNLSTEKGNNQASLLKDQPSNCLADQQDHSQLVKEHLVSSDHEGEIFNPLENPSPPTEPKQELLQDPRYSSFNHGPLLREEAEARLKDCENGAGLLRYSTNANGFVISYKLEGKVKHCCLEGKSVEQVLQAITQKAKAEIRLFSPRISESPFYHEGIVREDAAAKLKDQPEGRGLLRRSTSQNDFAISYKSKGKVYHVLLEGRSLEQVMQELGITQFLLPEQLVLPLSTNGSQEAKLSRKYSQQLILNLGSGRSGAGLNAKAAKKGLQSTMIDLRDSSSSLALLSALTPSSRLYIIGHCSPGLDFIESDDGKRITVDEYVSMLVNQAPHLIQNSSKQRLKVSLVACYGGKDKEKDNEARKSFGYRLSQALDKAGIQAEILARTSYVSRWQGRPEDYKKFVGGKYHQPGSKVVFTTERGKTSVQDFDYGRQ